uniref:Putative secreted peptide n=1 Tax=Anopheles braziliensis TaxID=58242 RepID=A0A2M3ZQP0_9DIPT
MLSVSCCSVAAKAAFTWSSCLATSFASSVMCCTFACENRSTTGPVSERSVSCKARSQSSILDRISFSVDRFTSS